MAASVEIGVGPDDVDAAEGMLRRDGLAVSTWSNAPGDMYGWHAHAHQKVLYCVRGSIVFHTDDGDVELHGGDRLVLDAGTRHAATVGPHGVTCTEAPRR